MRDRFAAPFAGRQDELRGQGSRELLRRVAPDPSFGIRRGSRPRACAQAKVGSISGKTNSLAFAQTLAASTGLATFLPRVAVAASLEAGLLVAVPLRIYAPGSDAGRWYSSPPET